MEVSFKKIGSEPEFETIKNLYLLAFPVEERREFDELKKQLYYDECVVNLIIADGKVAGFCIIWDFSDFVFLEHFAIDPELRGLGIGEGVLTLLREKYPVILLETELPVDEISQRRVKFYQRNGFRMLQRQYIQPSYGKNKPEIELQLMSTNIDFSVETLDEYIRLIREKVYRDFS